MKLFISFLLVFLQVFTPTAYAGTKTIVKSDILEGNVADIDILGSNGHFERNAIGWAAYDDAAADPVDATGGTSTTTCARSTSSPIDGDGSLLMTKTGGASYQGEGCALTFTVPANLSGEPLQISFEYAVASGTYADDAVELWLYNSTGTTLIQPAPTLLKNHSLNRQTYKAEFQPTYSTSAQTFRLALHIGATDTTAYTLKFDNFRLYKGRKSYGSPIADWSTSATGSDTSNNSVVTYNWRRNGDTMEIDYSVSFSGAGDGGTYAVNLPSGYVIDTTKTRSRTLGHFLWNDSGTALKLGSVQYGNTTQLTFIIDVSGAALDGSVFASGDTVSANVRVPILGWSSSQVMSSDASTRVIGARFNNSATSISGTPAKVVWTNTDKDDVAGYSSGTYTIKVPGWYDIYASLYIAATPIVDQVTQIFIYRNGASIKDYLHRYKVASATSTSVPIYDSFYFNVGDTVEIYASSDATSPSISSSTTKNVFSISRRAGPAQIAASDTVGALYTGAPPTGTLNSTPNITTFGTKVKDSHGVYLSGSYIVQMSGQYDIGAAVDITHASIAVNQYAGIAIYIDGVQKYVRYAICSSTSVVEYYPQIEVKAIPLLTGQVVTIRSFSTGTTPTFTSNATTNNFYITRTGNY